MRQKVAPQRGAWIIEASIGSGDMLSDATVGKFEAWQDQWRHVVYALN